MRGHRLTDTVLELAISDTAQHYHALYMYEKAYGNLKVT